MVKGFYNLTSGMLTQRRTLDVISTNMSNVSTIGYKADTLLSSTFDEALLSRTGNEDKAHPEGLADTSMARIPRETVTNFDIGNLRPSYSPLDFAIISDGFFQVQNENGEVRYTRNGSFNIDDRGYICTQDGDLVLGENGPIQVYYPDSETQFNAEKVQVDQSGNVSDSDGNFVDKFAIVTFADTTQLVKQDGYTLVPLSVYFKDSRVKVEVGLCKGKKNYDKRDAAAQRDARREMERAMKTR